MTRHLALLLPLGLVVTTVSQAQLVLCTRDSPERRGEPGCSIVADKRLPVPPLQPVLWHIDEFESLAAAQRAEGPTSIAFAAHGSAWLYDINADTSNHHGGKHRAVVGSLAYPGEPHLQHHGYVRVFSARPFQCRSYPSRP